MCRHDEHRHDRTSAPRRDLLERLGAVIVSTQDERSRDWDRESEDAFFEKELDDDRQEDPMSRHEATHELPKAGDTLRCETCGMQVKIEKDCRCEQGEPRLECCGQPLG
jgi:hypothetical protein